MNKKLNILVFPCGSEIALEVHRSLKDVRNINLIGANSIDDHGKFVFNNYIEVPLINDENFISFLKTIVSEKKIDFIIPCMDIVLPKLKSNENIIGCKIITSDLKTVEICLSKRKTYNLLKNTIRTPNILEKSSINYFPVFSKPEIGASSRNTFIIRDTLDLEFYTKKFPENLLLEYLPGEEYTIDCFTKKNGELLFIGPRIRSRISNGISVNTKIIEDNEIKELAQRINEKMKFSGSWFFQLKKDKNNNYCLLEVASRFGGSSLIQRYRGLNFSLMNIYNELDFDLEICVNDISLEIDRSLDIVAKSNIKFETAYIDLDDTLIINDKVNISLISLIYKFINDKKEVILITKHEGSVENTLNKHLIPINIFRQIIKIDRQDKKHKYMKKDSIFIDDSFSERKEVSNNLKIPTFAPDTINILF